MTYGAAPAGPALDRTAWKLSWVRETGGPIGRANLDGTGVETFLGGLSHPLSLATLAVTSPPPAPTIDSGPPNPSNQTTATSTFSSSQRGVSFLCQLDGSGFLVCASPAIFSDPLSEGDHTFEAKAYDAEGVPSATTSYTWSIDTTAPGTTITSGPPLLTTSTTASFTFTATGGAIAFECRLDAGGFAPCSSPATYTGRACGLHRGVGVRDQRLSMADYVRGTGPADGAVAARGG